LKDRFSLDAERRGFVITDVTPGTSAAEPGLQPGDVILEVHQSKVASPAEIGNLLYAALSTCLALETTGSPAKSRPCRAKTLCGWVLVQIVRPQTTQ
jgi:hypothetical protein